METGDSHRQVYVDKGVPLLGLPLSIVGIIGTVAMARHAIISFLELPHDPSVIGSYVVGTIGSLLVLALGCRMLVRGEVVLDKAASEITRSRNWFFWRFPVATSLEGYTGVAWRHRWRHPTGQTDSNNTIYPVCLTGREPELELFSVIFQMQEARRLTDEVASFLGLPAEHLDQALLAAPADAEGASRPAHPTALELQRLLAAQVIVSRPDANRLVCRTAFPSVIRAFGAAALVMGLLFLFAPVLGIHVDMRDRAGRQGPWDVPMLGGAFVGFGILFALGCRGFTIRKDAAALKQWWGLLVPLVWRQHDLQLLWSLAIGRRVTTTSSGYPVVQHTVRFQAPTSGEAVTIFRSLSRDEARAIAQEVAAFLSRELVDETAQPAQ